MADKVWSLHWVFTVHPTLLYPPGGVHPSVQPLCTSALGHTRVPPGQEGLEAGSEPVVAVERELQPHSKEQNRNPGTQGRSWPEPLLPSKQEESNPAPLQA